MASANELFRLYSPDEIGADGYPPEWHATIKHAVRADAGHRCVRCHHPYRNGEHGNGEWTPCDSACAHSGPFRYAKDLDLNGWYGPYEGDKLIASSLFTLGGWDRVEARWRILTVHHLNGDKADCRWWNLAALCQRCHLTIQGRVVMERAFMFEHSDWFKPYAAGWYAWKYLSEEIDRAQAVERQDELLALERVA